MKRKKDQMALHLMMLPGMILLAIFSFTPMFGIIMAFQNYMPARGIAKSPWVGMDNFIFMFQMPDSKQIFINTITIAVGKIILSTFVTIVFALLLNEIKNKFMKRSIQTIVYLPNFLSWRRLGSISFPTRGRSMQSLKCWGSNRFCSWPAINGSALS